MCQLAVNFRAIHFMSRQKRCYSAVVYLQFIEEIFFQVSQCKYSKYNLQQYSHYYELDEFNPFYLMI